MKMILILAPRHYQRIWKIITRLLIYTTESIKLPYFEIVGYSFKWRSEIDKYIYRFVLETVLYNDGDEIQVLFVVHNNADLFEAQHRSWEFQYKWILFSMVLTRSFVPILKNSLSWIYAYTSFCDSRKKLEGFKIGSKVPR